MPSKIQLDENLWFLYICLQKSDLKTIDFNAVGHVTSLKPPAARMRYTRLRRQIESGTLIGTHGTPFASTSASEKIAERASKRKRGDGKEKKETTSEDKKKEPDGERAADVDVSEEDTRKIVGVETKIKKEESGGYGNGGDTGEDDSDETDFWSSEDEIPLAKLRKAKRGASLHAGILDEDAGFRAEREGAPVREFQRDAQPQSQPQVQPRLQVSEEMNGIQYYRHAPNVRCVEMNRVPSGPALHMYSPAPQHPIHAPLSPFGDAFGSLSLVPYQAGWYQLEDARAVWGNDMGPLQGYSGWKPRKSV